MGFTKLDSGIVDSSVWSEPLATRVVWVTILAKCDQDHMVRCSRSGLRRAANVTEEDFESAIKTLEAPDPESRTKTDDGRRIRPIEGGWFVVNHGQYRQYSYSSTPEAVRQRKHREKNTDVTEDVTRHKKRDIGRDISASVSASASSSEDGECEGKGEFEEFWDAYPVKIAKIEAGRAFSELRETVSVQEIQDAFNGYMDYLKQRRVNGFDQAPMYPARFLKDENWKVFVGFKYNPPL